MSPGEVAAAIAAFLVVMAGYVGALLGVVWLAVKVAQAAWG